jgi:hypothetical protein
MPESKEMKLGSSIKLVFRSIVDPSPLQQPLLFPLKRDAASTSMNSRMAPPM